MTDVNEDNTTDQDAESWGIDTTADGRLRFDPGAVTTTQTPAPAIDTIPLSGQVAPTERSIRTTTPSLRQDSVRTVSEPVRPSGRLEDEQREQFRTGSIEMTQVTPEVSRTVQAGEATRQIEDPFYSWKSATPYDSGRPSVVLHVSPENRRGDSLAFLERRLRDEYTQRRGGDPRAKRVRMVAGKPKIPDVSGAVATFDLTGDEWELDFRSDTVRVERDGRDALEYVEAIVDTGFAGELGYLVVNVPNDWGDRILDRDVFARIHERIGPSPERDTLRSSDDGPTDPPLVTRCRPAGEIEFPVDASAYWFGQRLDADRDGGSLPATVEGVEDRFDRVLRETDWLSTVLTEEHDGDESDEHYLLKGAVAASIVRATHDEASSALDEYVFETVLADGKLETEYGDGPRVDIHATFDDPIDSFVPWPDEVGDSNDLVIEVETGRGEGRTQFRKLWNTVDRLADDEYADAFVCVVIPPRLLTQTREQAEYLCQLMRLWNRRIDLEDSKVEGPRARLAVPVFDESGSCRTLREAETFVEEVYERGLDGN
jgi:hypothetical protein